MTIAHRIDQKLEIRLEVILVCIRVRVDALLYPFKFCENIDCRLLVSFRWNLEVRKGRLELYRLVEVFDESRYNRRVERNTYQTCISA
jgi:hypothetical protein